MAFPAFPPVGFPRNSTSMRLSWRTETRASLHICDCGRRRDASIYCGFLASRSSPTGEVLVLVGTSRLSFTKHGRSPDAIGLDLGTGTIENLWLLVASGSDVIRLRGRVPCGISPDFPKCRCLSRWCLKSSSEFRRSFTWSSRASVTGTRLG
jgi:hypothetical protein